MGMLPRQFRLAFVAAAVVATVAVGAAWRRWAPDWHASRTSAESPEKYLSPDELDELQLQYLLWCIPEKQRVANALIRGDVTLWEAAACFRHLEAMRPSGNRPSHEYVPGNSTEECLCRQVIGFVCGLRGVDPQDPKQDPFVLWLQCELEEQLSRGAIRLPDPPPGIGTPFNRDGVR
jgi:hypothetical protein